jgi:hypothetical protein
MKRYIKKKSLVLGIIILITIAGSMTALGKRYRSIPDPDLSTVELTNPNSYVGLTTCPYGVTCPIPEHITYDGYLKVTVISIFGEPMADLSANLFEFEITPTQPETQWYGDLKCIFTEVGSQTNANGEIEFEIMGNTSIVGNITIEVSVMGIQITDNVVLRCNSFDDDCDGFIALGDLSVWQQRFVGTLGQLWRADYDWDTFVALGDLSRWQQHFVH